MLYEDKISGKKAKTVYPNVSVETSEDLGLSVLSIHVHYSGGKSQKLWKRDEPVICDINELATFLANSNCKYISTWRTLISMPKVGFGVWGPDISLRLSSFNSKNLALLEK